METSNKLTGEQLSLWTSSAVDIPVSHLAQQENEEEQTIHDISGDGSVKPLANYDPDTQSWKMCEDISLWGEYRYLESLPKSGMTRNGVLYQQPDWVRLIGATGSSLLPTPTVDNSKNVNPKPNRRRGLVSEVNKRLMEPTPTAITRPMEGNVRLYRAKIRAGEMTEAEAEAILGKSPWAAQGRIKAEYPTMSANGMGNTGSRQILQRKVESGQMTEEEKLGMSAGNGGKLNPMWVEWLMGFPIGWTDLED
jgi:hypothetical protein